MASRNYVFTKFVNDQTEYSPYLNQLKCTTDSHLRYLICQLEECPKTHRVHVQGYVEFDKMTTLKQAKRYLGNDVHLEKRQGTQEQAIQYCSKAETQLVPPFTIGKKAVQGERTDLNRAAELITEGHTVEEVIKKNGNLVRYINQLDKWYARINCKTIERTEKPPEVEVLIGAPGTGKTTSVLDKETDLWEVPEPVNGHVWFDNYQGQEAVIFDDFYGGIKYHYLLKLLDAVKRPVPIKGGFTVWKPKRIYITSNKKVDDWYKIQDMRALKRRITKISIFEERGNTNPLPIEYAN